MNLQTDQREKQRSEFEKGRGSFVERTQSVNNLKGTQRLSHIPATSQNEENFLSLQPPEETNFQQY